MCTCVYSDYDQLVDQVAAREEVKKIICISIPPLGEAVGAPEPGSTNERYTQLIMKYRCVMQDTVKKYAEKAVYVPFGETLEEKLAEIKASAEGSKYDFKSIDFDALVGDPSILYSPMLGKYLKNKVLRKERNAYCDANRRYFMQDHIHFNGRAVDILTGLLAEHLIAVEESAIKEAKI